MRNSAQPIAIIGVACRTPGANNPEEFWHLLSTGQDQISALSLQRWSLIRPNLSSQALEKVHQESPICWGGFLNQVDQFDPAFFGISAREAVSMSPQHRLLLEVAWEALENAALRPDQLTKTNTGVFLGLTSCDYSHLAWKHHDLADPYLTTGTNSSIAASRISYLLNLSGPSVVVDTACSSSLVAINLACQSIQAGESTMALAGGVNLALNPDVMFNLASGGFQAPDGRCKTFDSRADGYVRGEGVGLVLLKPLAQALADGDPIHALILGSAVNQDGRTQGITAPKPTAQEAVVRQAYQQAGVSPGQVQYVETHGTGTKLGDPIELGSLGKVLKDGRNPDDVCLVGAVKTNIGHLEAASGIAGLIKVVLSLQHRQIPPNLHFQSPNPYIPFGKLPVEVPQALTAWPSYGDDAIAGVSAFSFGGTNAHVVLQAAPNREKPIIQIERPLHLLTLSAKSPTALKDSAQRYEKHLQHHTEQTLGDICYTANIGRAHHDYRLAIVSTSKTDLIAKLTAFDLGDDNSSVLKGQRSPNTQSNIAFLFTGQGSQYVDMGRELYETQLTFGRVLDQCADILQEVNVPLLEVLYDQAEGDEQKININNTAYTQPALFALEYALYKLWQSWGLTPSVVMGHSVGEYVAACVAGVFSLEDGLKLIAARGRLMQQLPSGGGMVSLMAAVEQVKTAIADQPDVSIAAINGPQSTVISGPIAALQTMVEQFAKAGVKGKFLSVSHAFHSPLMTPMLAEFEQVAQQISYSLPQLKLISNVTGKVVTEQVATPEYWCEHILSPVNFAAGMECLQQEEIDIFLECGPQSILLGMGRQCLPEDENAWLPSLRPGQDDWQQMLSSLGELYVRGVNIDGEGLETDYPQRRKVALPTYPFQRQLYWIEDV
ncbi:MAG: type I polyketide synthase, partial [Cyanobacteria bacterium P01_F01_bin.86]